MRQQGWTVVVTAVATVGVLLSAYGVKQVVAERTQYGTCNNLTAECHDVPVATLELVAGYWWNDRTSRVVESSASLSHGLLGSPEVVSGVIELHDVGEGVSLGEGASYPGPRSGRPMSTEEGESILKRLGATDIRTLRNRDQLIVLRGETTDSSSLIYVYSLLSR